jgi:hypothetical protein
MSNLAIGGTESFGHVPLLPNPSFLPGESVDLGLSWPNIQSSRSSLPLLPEDFPTPLPETFVPELLSTPVELSALVTQNIGSPQPGHDFLVTGVGSAALEPDALHPVIHLGLAHLDQFRQTVAWPAALTLAFGDEWAIDDAAAWLDTLLQPHHGPTTIAIPLAHLGAYGAFAPTLNTIFIAQELLDHPAHQALAVDVWLEEVGHWLDAQLNPVDSPGDEGAIFSALVQQKPLSTATLAHLKAKDDWAELIWQGQRLSVQQSAVPGLFTVGPSGQVNVEFLFDSGAYTGQVALFSMAGLETLNPASTDFIQAATQRALSNSSQGYIVVSEPDEGASLSGQLGERNYNTGSALGNKAFTFQPGDTLALMLVPNGRLQSVAANPTVDGDLRPLFSIAAANPLGRTHYGALTNNPAGLVLGIEDIRFDTNSDGDFNDVLLKLEGVTGQLDPIETLVQSRQTWLTSPLGRDLFAIAPVVPPTDPIQPNPIEPSPLPGQVVVALNASVVKFNPNITEAQLIASDAARITLGSQRIYIGTDQVSAINQNPILASFDALNPANNWIRSDYETTGADGRGYGVAVTPAGEVYAFFSVDGTQGSPPEDFRRVSNGAEQAWLRSYGQGGGPKVSVIGKIDPATGNLIAAAYLSAVLGNGNSNTLTITGLALQPNGNLLVSAQSFFSPRQPNGQPMALDNDPTTPETSPFAYFVEITPDLKRVESTSATGWI